MADNTFYGLEYELNGVPLGDIEIKGKALREWRVEEFISYEHMGDWQVDLYEKITVGDDLQHIIGEEFREAFYERRNGFIDAETKLRAADHNYRHARAVWGDEAVIDMLHSFVIPHPGWEMDDQYAVVRVNGEIRFVGTDHGSPKEVSRKSIETYRDRAAQQLADINLALEKALA